MKNKTLKLFTLFTFTLISNIALCEESNTNNNIKKPDNINFIYTKESNYEKNTKQKERIFPLFREQVEARNIHLPLPFGISFLGNVTNIDSTGSGIDVDFEDHSLSDFPLEIEGNITAQISGIMLDFYPFPFMNVFGYGAYIRTSGDLKLGIKGSPKVKTKFGDDGTAYGLGTNISGGYKHFFAGLNTSLSASKMNSTGALKKTFVLTPRIGVKSDSNKFQLWTGLMYMNKDSQLKGDMPANTIGPLPAFTYSINLEGPTFSPTLGFRYEPLEHLEIICEAFFASDFNGVNMRLAYRF